MIYFVYSVLYLLIFFTGACVGSFLNVVIYRVPEKISIAKGRSFCPKCKEQIRVFDLIPLISWMVLKGRCRNCKNIIPFHYIVVEILGGIFLVLSFLNYRLHINTLIVFWVVMVLVAIAFIDLKHMIIPNSLIISLIIPALLLIFFMPDVTILSRVIGFFCISIPMYLVCLFVDGAFGGGDIKLMAVCGFVLGWENILFAFFIAVILAGGYVVILMLKKKTNKKAQFPFGPFLSLGIIIALFWGDIIIEYYFRFTNNLFI